MHKTLRRIFYYSEALARPDEIPALIRLSRANNSAYAVTGALIYTGSRFGQLIEGPPAHIETLFANIRADTRHRDIHVCFDDAGDERWADRWSMGYLTNIEFTQYVARLGDGTTGGGAWHAATFRTLMEAAETL